MIRIIIKVTKNDVNSNNNVNNISDKQRHKNVKITLTE